MKLRITLVSGALLAGTILPATLRAQQHNASPAARNLLIVDSITPTKKLLRDYIAQLRDTLTHINATNALIARANANGANAVVVSNGRYLAHACASAAAMVLRTTAKVSSIQTTSELANQALSTYRGGLSDLHADMLQCIKDDSTVVGSSRPDKSSITAVAAAATDAVDRYNSIRDALLKLLSIDLPMHGTIYVEK